MAGHFDMAPTLDDIEAMAKIAFDEIPDELRRHVTNLTITVQDFAEDDVLEEMGIESPFELLGLYQGVDMVRRAISDPVQENERVFLYRRALLDVWCEGEDSLPDIVRHVLIHEIGHHFGYSDEDMEAIEDAY